MANKNTAFQIDQEFQNLIPPLSADEKAQLEANILRDGCRDALVTWKGILVDGHHRFEICTRHGLAFTTRDLDVADRRAAKLWAIETQVGRRNLTTAQKADLAHRYKVLVAEPEAQKRQFEAGAAGAEYGKLGGRGNKKPLEEIFPQGGFEKEREAQARDVAAEKFGISGRTLDKWEDVLDHGDEETITAARVGEISVSKAHQLINQSGCNEWYTPAEYVEAARRVMGRIDLDPASCEEANQTVKARRFLSQSDDGFAKNWEGTIWCNPPYGREEGEGSNQARWTAKLVEEYNAGRIEQACLLVNAVPGNSWFAPLWEHLLCFPAKRIRFVSPGGKVGSPTHSNVIVYFGRNRNAFIDEFGEFGPVVDRAVRD